MAYEVLEQIVDLRVQAVQAVTNLSVEERAALTYHMREAARDAVKAFAGSLRKYPSASDAPSRAVWQDDIEDERMKWLIA